MGPALQTVDHRLQDFSQCKLLVKFIAVSLFTREQVGCVNKKKRN